MAVSQSAAQPSSSHCLFNVAFNQDYTGLCVGYKSGYKLFVMPSVDSLTEVCHSTEIKEVVIVERLFLSSLVSLVSLQTPRKLNVYHFKKGTEICNYSYNHTILSVKLNRTRVVVCLEESIFIHSIKDMKVLHIIKEVPKNPDGICDLSPCTDNCLLAYPGSSSVGQVQLFDASNLQFKILINAHDTSLAALAFNESGSKLVTASEKGTLIRVFNAIDGAKLHELRRGMKTCATIRSLSFALDSNFVVASSNKETVHIFKLEDPAERPKPEPEDQTGLGAWVTSMVSTSAAYLPSQVADIWSQDRAFATLTLPAYDMKTSCVLTLIDGKPYVLVASSEGALYVYDIDIELGGECTFKHKHKFDDNTNSTSGQSSPIPTTEVVAKPGASYAQVLSGPAGDEEKDSQHTDSDSLNLDDQGEYPCM